MQGCGSQNSGQQNRLVELYGYTVNLPLKTARMNSGEMIDSSMNSVGENGYPYAEGWDRTLILHHTRNQPKWIKHLKVRPESVKLPEENIGEKLFVTGLENGFSDLPPLGEVTKAKTNY